MRKNILYIGIGPFTGGPVVSLIQLIEQLDKNKFIPYVFSLPNPHPDTIQQLKNNKNVHIVEKDIWINNWLKSSKKSHQQSLWHYIKAPGRWCRLIYNSWQISKIIKVNDIQLVHTNIELVLEGAIAAWFARVPHIWHIRAPLGNNGAVKHFLGERFCCSVISLLSDFVIVNSNTTKESVEKYINSNKIRLIYNGINPDEFQIPTSNNRLRKLFDISADKKIIASIGYLSELKGGREFLNIAMNICKTNHYVIFIWIGESFERKNDIFCKEIFEIIKHNKLESRILFTGERSDINMLLTDVDLFLQPMTNGSWSRVVLEAMAASIPVIAIEKDLTSEFITDGENGILVRNEIEAAERIRFLLTENDLLSQISKNGNQMVISNYTNQITAKKIMGVYDEIQYEN